MIYTYKMNKTHYNANSDSGMIWGDIIYQSYLYRFLHFPNSLKKNTQLLF